MRRIAKVKAAVTATRGSMVQVPMQTIYSIATVGDKPALRFEVNIARAKTLYPQDAQPPSLPGYRWIPVVLNRQPAPYDRGNQPHINLFDLAKAPGYRGGRFVHDDRAVANIIYGYEKDLPPLNPNDKVIISGTQMAMPGSPGTTIPTGACLKIVDCSPGTQLASLPCVSYQEVLASHRTPRFKVRFDLTFQAS